MSNRPSHHCHKMIAEVAKSAANELYDEVMRDNMVRIQWKKQYEGLDEKTLRVRFVTKFWSRHIEFARATLARLLATSSDEELKSTIYEALCLDNTLIRGRAHGETYLAPQPVQSGE